MKKFAVIFALALCLALTSLVACTDSQADPSDTTDTQAETWLCACGQGNGGKFCSECGTPRPEPETTDPVTEAPTEAPTASKPEAPTEPAEKKGCGATVMTLSAVILIAASAVALKKKED